MDERVLATDTEHVGLAQEKFVQVEAIGAGARFGGVVELLPLPIRQQALQQVDADLVAEGLLDKVGGVVSDEGRKFTGTQVASFTCGSSSTHPTNHLAPFSVCRRVF